MPGLLPLNFQMRKESKPYPRIDVSLDALCAAHHFSVIHLTLAYNQVEVYPDDQHKTAFTTPMYLFQYSRMAFGLCNAPTLLQRLMETTISGDLLQILLVNLDYIVYTDNIVEHL